jgi:branched-chain amino acid aminotransferase
MAVAAWEWGAYYGDAKFKGAKLDIAKWKRPSPETIPCFAKAAGLYMICTMSKHAAEANGCSDAMMLDYRGYVAEATGANLFFVKDGDVHTPKPDCFLNGITRQTVIGMLQERGIKVIERHIMPEELEGFEQCWLTGTAAEVTPVGHIGDYSFEVGALARDIAESYEKLVVHKPLALCPKTRASPPRVEAFLRQQSTLRLSLPPRIYIKLRSNAHHQAHESNGQVIQGSPPSGDT